MSHREISRNMKPKKPENLKHVLLNLGEHHQFDLIYEGRMKSLRIIVYIFRHLDE